MQRLCPIRESGVTPCPPSLPPLSSRPARPQVGCLNVSKTKQGGRERARTCAARNGRRGRRGEGRNIGAFWRCLRVTVDGLLADVSMFCCDDAGQGTGCGGIGTQRMGRQGKGMGGGEPLDTIFGVTLKTVDSRFELKLKEGEKEQAWAVDVLYPVNTHSSANKEQRSGQKREK